MHIRGLPLPLPTYRKRRQRAAALIAKAFDRRVPLLLVGCDEDTLRRVRQDQWFDYYTGCQEPEAALLIDPNAPARDTLFLDPTASTRWPTTPG
jgi:hypothetical protein